VAKIQNGSIAKQYYYDAGGQMIEAADGGGVVLWAEIYAGGRHLATWNSAGRGATYFNYADWIGTERVRTDSSGTVCETITSLPFGDGQSISGNCGGGDSSPNHFTGLERDSESGLDHTLNRQLSSNIGRWLSPDPGGIKVVNLQDPQTWDMYSYVADNPLTLTDPSGLCGERRILNGVVETDSADVCGAVDANETKKKGETAQMSLSQKGLEFIERHEGYSDRVYNDSAGNPTIGYGHLIKEGEDFSKGITKEKAGELLSQDTKAAVDAVNGKVTGKLSQTKFDALVDFTYNLGGGNLGKSTLLKNINAGKDLTQRNFTDWNRAGGKVVNGLTNRRVDEWNLFSKGDYGGP
jgi:RHS repeat-associated protein